MITGIVFSKDRALQLDGLLNSFKLHCVDPENICLVVLYATSTNAAARQYEELEDEHLDVEFVREHDFKNDLLNWIGFNSHVFFVCDDCLFIRPFILATMRFYADNQPRATCFNLSLGSNCQYCYPHAHAQSVPIFHRYRDDVLAFDWTQAEHDWGYPISLIGALYNLGDIRPTLRESVYEKPNELEDRLVEWAHANKGVKCLTLCRPLSSCVCIPVNLVQVTHMNRVGSNPNYSTEVLSKMFDAGYRMDHSKYSGLTPTGPHMELEFDLVRLYEDRERRRDYEVKSAIGGLH